VAEDIWAYLAQREKELKGLSVHAPDITAAEEEGSDGQRGRLIGRAWLNDEAFIEIHEVVRVRDKSVTRVKYAYYLCINGEEVGGYERDPTHDPSEHKHCSEDVEHETTSAPAVSFKQAMDEAWDYISGLYDDGDVD
jgi:hypothetical protein